MNPLLEAQQGAENKRIGATTGAIEQGTQKGAYDLEREKAVNASGFNGNPAVPRDVGEANLRDQAGGFQQSEAERKSKTGQAGAKFVAERMANRKKDQDLFSGVPEAEMPGFASLIESPDIVQGASGAQGIDLNADAREARNTQNQITAAGHAAASDYSLDGLARTPALMRLLTLAGITGPVGPQQDPGQTAANQVNKMRQAGRVVRQ